MGIEYYVFAMFIAVLVCVVAIIFKILFSDVKRKNEMLDERERKVLETYNSVETIMEEFQDQAKATIDELKLREQEYRAAMQNMAAFQLPEELIKKAPAVLAPNSGGGSPAAETAAVNVTPINAYSSSNAFSPENKILELKTESKPASKPAVFQKFFDDALEAPPPTPYSPAQVNGGSKRDSILALADEGKTDVEIASRLGITRNEVQLVVGLTGNAGAR